MCYYCYLKKRETYTMLTCFAAFSGNTINKVWSVTVNWISSTTTVGTIAYFFINTALQSSPHTDQDILKHNVKI